ncbi:MAG: hypothetical protein JST85_15855 [Acidobacteria bacterium]|nr:hypothetical protein [Acidobacteriota bacterium]
MRNLWIQTENPFATWVADLTKVCDSPEPLLEFIAQVIRSGSEQLVFTVVEAPEINFVRSRTSDLIAQLRQSYKNNNVVDLFGFTGAAMAPGSPGSSTVEATMAWFDGAGRRVLGACNDLGYLLQTLDPVEGSIPIGFMKRFPPLRVTGQRLIYAGSPPKLQNYRPTRSVTVRFAIHSDIWFPWVYGSAHPHCDHKHMFDNRELSIVHTPRLNEFLIGLAAKTREIGGEWFIDETETGEDAIRWLDELGIDLDPDPPQLQMPSSALDAEWY